MVWIENIGVIFTCLITYISRSADGRVIIVKNIEKFARLVLPRYFKHANFQSFVRQLHIYDFHKTATIDPNHVGYANENFRQGRKDLIPLVIDRLDGSWDSHVLLDKDEIEDEEGGES